jgi:hypothetical protein
VCVCVCVSVRVRVFHLQTCVPNSEYNADLSCTSGEPNAPKDIGHPRFRTKRSSSGCGQFTTGKM